MLIFARSSRTGVTGHDDAVTGLKWHAPIPDQDIRHYVFYFEDEDVGETYAWDAAAEARCIEICRLWNSRLVTEEAK